QVLMNELHSHRTFAHAGSYALHRPMPYIANRKNTCDVRLQQEGIAVQHPSLRSFTIPYQVRTSQDKAALISLDQACEPLGAWEGADENEDRGGRHALNPIRIRTHYGNLFQSLVAVDLSYARMCPDLDIGCLLNLVD